MSTYIPDVIYFDNNTGIFIQEKYKGKDVWVNPSLTPLNNHPTQKLINKPFDGARIVSGDYFKQTYCIEFKSDGKVFVAGITDGDALEIMHAVGIRENGVIPAELIWVGKPPMPVRIGSSKYEDYSRKEQMKDLKPFKKSELVEGHMYESLNGSRGAFLGSVSTVSLDLQQDVLVAKARRNRMLWITHADEARLLRAVREAVETDNPLNYDDDHGHLNDCDINVKGSHSFKLDHGQICDVSADAIERIRRATVRNQHVFDEDNWSVLSWHLYFQSELYTMTADKPTVPKDVKDLIHRSKYTLLAHDAGPEDLPEFLAHTNEEIRNIAKERLRKAERRSK